MVIAGEQPILVSAERTRPMSPAPRLACLQEERRPGDMSMLGSGLTRPGNDSRLSPAKSPSGNISADPYAKIFGLSLAALGALCLVLNAASPSTRICPQSDRESGTTGTASPLTRVAPAPEDGSHVQPSATIRSKECATNNGGEEPGYR
jgi:hypothetical protein